VALHPIEQAAPYPIEVHHRVRRDVLADYIQAARALERCVDVASIQHEFGIWGGQDGAYVLDFIRELRVPAVTTLHTVPGDPTPNQLALLTELVARSESTVVMSNAAAALLTGTYGADPSRLDVIPHGVPDLPWVDADTVKAGLEMTGRLVMLSFGLLGPDKGFELAIDALPAIVARHPTACYVIVGATRPDLLRSEGEAYRERLVARVARLKLQRHVRFLDRFVGRVELIRWLQAADVFVTPYPQPDLSVAGTLAYAMGAGRAVVSTPYPYAAELLADGRGTLVPHGSARDLAAGVNAMLGDPDRRAAIGRRAHEYSRSMVWSAVGAEYRRVLARATTNPPALQPLAPWSAVTI
jgi:glycosyltransferase involved in cell wall biosynthesis